MKLVTYKTKAAKYHIGAIKNADIVDLSSYLKQSDKSVRDMVELINDRKG